MAAKSIRQTHTPHHPGKTLGLCEVVYRYMEAHSHYMAGDGSMISFMSWVCIFSHVRGELLGLLGTWKLLWTVWVVLLG